MNDLIIFGGTSEGRRLTEYFKNRKINVTVCVATEYGRELAGGGENITVKCGRLDKSEIISLIEHIRPAAVIDATHPYASEVTANIKAACEYIADVSEPVEYIRVVRDSSITSDCDSRYFGSTEEAVSYLDQTEGNILLTTGSKELASYCGIKDREKRVFVRILPMADGLAKAEELGYRGKHVICMQGPFTEDMNEALIRMLDIKYLVTKDTGSGGGLPQKLEAAAKTGTEVVIIGRPADETGFSVKQCVRYIDEKYCPKHRQHIFICGMGMGYDDNVTEEVKKSIAMSDVVIGARRLLRSDLVKGKKSFPEINPQRITELIKENRHWKNIAVIMSGDTGFYSGTSGLVKLLEDEKNMDVTILCGISSVCYLAGKLKISWQDAAINSAHGRKCNYTQIIRRNEKSFFLLGGDTTAETFLRTLSESGLGYVKVAVGENLSYEEEKITKGTADELLNVSFDPLSAIYVFNQKAKGIPVTPGIADDRFIRGKVPMTKEEVRAVALSKLRLAEDSVVFDIGAGTGSVSVECALQAYKGHIFAIERKEEGCSLIEENRKAFGIMNMTVIRADAPEGLEGLPAPSHAFIGGSGGNLREIIQKLYDMNPDIRVVVDAVTLETQAEAALLLEEIMGKIPEVVQINIAKNRRAGRYNLMTAGNPVCVISCGGEQ